MHRCKAVQPGLNLNMSLKSNNNNFNKFNILEDETVTHVRKEFKERNKPLPAKQNNEDYIALKETRRRIRESQKLSNEKNAEDLRQKAVEAQNLMNAQFAASRMEKLTLQKTPEEKEHCRQQYIKRTNERKYNMRGHTTPLDVHNELMLNDRLRLYGRHHRCIHNKKHDILIKTEDRFIPKCTHFEAKIIKVEKSSKHQCKVCGFNEFTHYRNKCLCRARTCNRCMTNNYIYHDVMLPDGTQVGDVHQIYDAHMGGSPKLFFTIQEPDAMLPTGEVGEEYLVKGAIKDISFMNISVDVASFTPKISKEKFLDGLKTDFDAQGNKIYASYAEKLQGKLKEKKDMEVEPSEEQGGMLTTMSGAAKGAVDYTSSSLKTAFEKISDFLFKMREKIAKSSIVGFCKLKASQFIDIISYYIGIFTDHIKFDVIIHLLNTLYRVINKDLTSSSISFMLLINSLATAEEHSLEKLRGRSFEDRFKLIDSAGCFSTIIAAMCRDPEWRRRYLKNHRDSGRITITSEGLEMVRQQSFLSYFIEVQDREEGFSFEYMFDAIKSKAGLLFSYETVKTLIKFCKELLPLFVSINLATNVCPKITNLISKYVFGSMTNEAWLEDQMYTEDSPIHNLMTTYLAYQSVTIARKSVAMTDEDINELRTKFYQYKLESQNYVMQEKRWCSRFTHFINHLENGMSTPPQPAERKQEPTLLVIYGPPGTGKSTIWPYIVSHVLGITPADVRATTYTWNSASEYQTGMSDKKVILYDDFGQNREDSLETLSLIHLCTSAPYPINSANITGKEIKGLYATPDIIVVCTNDRNLATDKIFSKEAVLRRVDLGVTMEHRLDLGQSSKGQRIFTISQSNRYRDIIDKKVDLSELTTLLHMTHVIKRKEYADIKSGLAGQMETVSLEVLSNLEFTVPTVLPDFITTEGNMRNDYAIFMEALVREKKEKKEEEDDQFFDVPERPRTRMERIRGWFSTEKSSEQSGYSVSSVLYLASAAIRHAGGFTMGVTFPIFIVAGMTSFVVDSFVFFQDTTLTCMKRAFYSGLKLAISVACTTFVAYSIYTYFHKDTEESGTTKTAKSTSKPLTVTSTSEGGDLYENVSLLFKRASGTLVGSNGRIINCLAIGGQWLLIPQHYFYDMESQDHLIKEGTGLVLKISTLPSTIKFKFERHRVRRIMNESIFFDGREVRSDVLLYLMDYKIMPAMKSIIKHFWDGDYDTTGMSVAKIDYIPSYNIESDHYDFVDNVKFDNSVNFDVSYGTVLSDRVCTYRDKGKDHYCHIVATASYKPRVRSCGSVVIRTDAPEKPALGIHVAATPSDVSMFHFVTSSELYRATKDIGLIDVEESGFVNTYANEQDTEFPSMHQFLYIGNTDKKHQSYQPIKTDLTPSLLYEALGPHKTEPSLLRQNDPRFPEDKKDGFYKTMFAGYAAVSNFKWDELEEATVSIIEDNRRAYKLTRVIPRMLTDFEVLNGTPEWPSIGRVPLDTSCGWPYNCEGKRKADLILDNGIFLEYKERLKEDYDHAELMIKSGIKPFLPFLATLKDERLPLEKIYVNPKSRIFMAGNVVKYLIGRKYFSCFMEMCYRDKDGYTAYLDRISLDWHDFISRLIEVGRFGFDGDYKHYDRMITRILLYCNFLISIDGLVNRNILHTNSLEYQALLELWCAPNVIFGRRVYMANGLLCSGDLLTYLGNCNINEVLHRAGYLSIMRRVDPRLGTISQYKAKTRGKRGGDDTIQMVADSISIFFNGITFGKWLQDHNIVYTTATKTGDLVEQKHFKELSFLKNTTGVMHGYYVPLGDMDSLIESCYWVRLNKNNADIVKATQDNTNASLRAIYFYGKDVFNNIRNTFKQKEPRLQLLTFEELNAIWDTYGYFPGSHSDYSTKKDQDMELTRNPENKFLTYGIRTTSKAKDMSLIILESEEQTGVDTATANILAEHPQVGLDESIGSVVEQQTPQSTINDNDGSQTNSNGAFIDSKEQVIKKSVKVGKIPITSADFRAQGHVNDKNWTLSKLASKFTSLGQYTWSISQPAGTVIKFWNLPNDVLVTPALRTPFDVTAYERFKSIRFKITTSASPFYAGRLICGFYPFFEETNGLLANSHLLLTQLGGVVINPVENQTFEFPIPFRHYLNWLEYPQDCMGQFAIIVLNPLQTGPENVNNITVSVFVTIEEAQFKVPEYVSNTTKSMRVMASKPQGDDGDTAITISKHVSSVNENFQDNYTMLCAGTGTYQEPTIKHFPDHPHDLVQVLKRDRPIFNLNAKLPAYDVPNARPGTVHFVLNYNDIVGELGGRYLVLYELWRGSIVIKGDFFCENAAGNPDKNWVGKMYFLNDRANVVEPAGGGIQEQQLIKGINYGYHKFDADHPPSCTLPYWSPNFVARSRGEVLPYQTPTSVLVIEIYNYSLKDSTIVGTIEARVDDDFAMGCFNGFPPMERDNKRKKAKKQKDGWTLLSMFSNEQSGVLDAVGTAANVAGDIADTIGDVARGVGNFVDIAARNLRPVMEVADMIGSMLDAPPITLQPTPMMPRKWNYGNANNILQYAEKLGNTNHNGSSYSDSSAFGANRVETNMYEMLQNIKTLSDTITWSTADASGKLLSSWQVGPTIDANFSKVASPIEYFARDFNYWAGSLIYAIDVVASQMHTGRLLLSYHPNLPSIPQTGFTMDMATQQYFISFDIDKGKGCVVVSTPYLYKSPFRVVTPFAGDIPTTYDVKQCYGGTVALWVMNPLRASTTVSQKVEINIYKMAGKDFRFEGYGSAVNASFR